MTIENEFFLGRKLILDNGTPWIGDESSGFPEDQLLKKPDRPVPPLLEERSYFEQFGGGKPNLE